MLRERPQSAVADTSPGLRWIVDVSAYASLPLDSLAKMPRISAFYGIVIHMYWQDHPAPHFHAFYSGDEAQVRIADGVVIAGSLPTTAARLVAIWAAQHREELLANWDRAQVPDTLLPIEGLR